MLLRPSQADEADVRQAQTLVQTWLTNASQVENLVIDFVQERKLKTLRRPLSRQGKIWLRRDGALRWQIDEPPARLLLRQPKADEVLSIDTRKRTWTALDWSDAEGNADAQGLRMLMDSQKPDLATFETVFQIRSAQPLPEAPGRWRIGLDLKDRRAAVAVSGVSFDIEPETGILSQMEFRLRDGSLYRTRVLRVEKSARIADEVFTFDLNGFTQTPP
ncbi:MAG: outer membrane lipoprotein carrier protein LolA [Verrucomicrobiales bacterium]|nr:outer membrane lipoprotein carrier protein LolA [Verrucomicrobiales bacterium]